MRQTGVFAGQNDEYCPTLKDLLSLYSESEITKMLRGTGRKIGEVTSNSGEALIRNFGEG